MRQPPKQEGFYRWRSLTFFALLTFSDCVFHQLCIWCHWWQYEAIPGPHRGYTGSPTPPGWAMNTCHFQRVCFVSQHSFSWKKFQEMESYSRRAEQDHRRPLTHQPDWYRLFCARENRMSTARATGVNVSDQTIRNRLREGSLRA